MKGAYPVGMRLLPDQMTGGPAVWQAPPVLPYWASRQVNLASC
jgi:hypothetical protein